MLSDPKIVDFESVPTLTIREEVAGDQVGPRLGVLLPKAYAAAGDKAAGAPFAIWHCATGTPTGAMFDMEAGTPVSEPVEGNGEARASSLPGGKLLQVTHTGPYEGLTEAYHEVMRWMKENGHESAGAPWDWYIDDPSETSQERCRTLICWPVA
jgi:effector-binding domain-containing protein